MDILTRLPVSSRKFQVAMGAVLAASVIAGVAQDYIEASFRNYHFYWSESVLFKAFWLPFLPIGWLLFKLPFQRYRWAVPVIATLIHLCLYALIIFIVSLLFFDHTYQLEPLLREAIASDLYKYMLVYSLLLFVPALPKASASFTTRLTITNGKNNLSVATSNIHWIGADDPYVAIYTAAGKNLATTSLKALQAQLDPEKFVRIHRSAIVNLSQVASFQSRLNGDYDVTLTNGVVLRLSRSFSKAFKERLSR